MSEIGIGSTVWVGSECRAISDAETSQFEIVGETPRSWVIGWKKQGPWTTDETFTVQKKPNADGERWTAKMSARGGYRWRVYVSREEIDAAYRAEREAGELRNWLWTVRPKIAASVGNCQDPAILRQVAALVGYTEGK